MNMKRTKVGQGYLNKFTNERRRAPVIWLVGGYAYAKDLAAWRVDYNELEGDLAGYVRVNPYIRSGKIDFRQVSDSVVKNDKHLPFRNPLTLPYLVSYNRAYRAWLLEVKNSEFGVFYREQFYTWLKGESYWRRFYCDGEEAHLATLRLVPW